MRVGEAINLDRDDFDPTAGLVRLRHTKFDKSRELPLHPSTTEALGAYARLRDRRSIRTGESSFFLSTAGTRLIYRNVHAVFTRLVAEAGLQPRSPRSRPRLHDLRHSLAVHSLLDWYRDGADVANRLPVLSTWLGHASPGATYWYLSAAPELLALAAERLATAQGQLP
jgi:integrase